MLQTLDGLYSVAEKIIIQVETAEEEKKKKKNL